MSDRPNERQLYETAVSQDGLFTAAQAAAAGYSRALLAHHVGRGRVAWVRRGIYRLTQVPVGKHDALVTMWLWSRREGVLSHETALSLHELMDVTPVRIHLTVPSFWKHRRLRAPEGVVMHFSTMPAGDWRWFGAVPVTTPERTLNDCALAHLPTELLRQGVQRALQRGIVRLTELDEVAKALQPSGGIEPPRRRR